MATATRRAVIASVVVLATALAPSAVAAERHPTPHGRLNARVIVKRVNIIDFAYNPKSITISVGTKVRWVNTGNASHSTTSNTSLWNSGVLSPGGSFARVFNKAGTFRYHCIVHPTLMHGVITVK